MFRLPVLLLTALLANALLIFAGNSGLGTPMGDLVFAYQPWADLVLHQLTLLGISSPWVYPYPALVPILFAALLTPGNLSVAWLALQLIMMLGVLIVMVLKAREKRAAYLAAYAWVGLTFALGPVAISRIDTFSVSLAILGALALSLNSARVAATWFTVAAWIKIWPIAMFLPLLFQKANRMRVFLVGAAVSLGFLSVGLLLGGNASLLSFVTGQTERGLQIESPAAMPWIWGGVFHDPDAGITYNQTLLTFEVFGRNTGFVAAWLGLVQLGALAITFTLGWLATRRGANAAEVIAWTALTGVCDLIFFNKVGSPQFISWLAVPIVLGLLLQVKNWQSAVVLVFATSLLTWWVYPVVYDDILVSGFIGSAILTLRNLAELALLIYANVQLTKQVTK